MNHEKINRILKVLNLIIFSFLAGVIVKTFQVRNSIETNQFFVKTNQPYVIFLHKEPSAEDLKLCQQDENCIDIMAIKYLDESLRKGRL